MPSPTSQADIFNDWESVLGAVTQNAALLPGVDPYKAELDGLLSQVKDLKVQQETLEGQRLGVTQKLKKVIADGKESVRKVRSYARIHLGSDNMSLKQFGVAPRVRRGPRKKDPGTPPPTEGPAGNPQPGQPQVATGTAQGKEVAHA